MFVVHLFGFLSFLLALRAFRDYRRRRGIPYPPGPRPLPVVGNLFDLPKDSLWLAFTRFSKKHGTAFPLVWFLSTMTMAGDILSLHIFGQVFVVLNSHKAIKDLLERRGDIYSDRPVTPFYEMCVLQSGHSCHSTDVLQDGYRVVFARSEIWRVLAPGTQTT